MAPTWNDLASKLADEKDVVVASVDCTVHRKSCEDNGIQGFPTLKTFVGGEAKEQYKGARTLNDLKDFVTEQRKLHMELTTA